MSSQSVVPVRIYFWVFVALLFLTAATTGVSFVDLGENWNALAALVIAIVKAGLVILYFMHVRFSPPLVWIVVGAGFFWLAILLVLLGGDVLTRG
jgi:cytochrome c oxidase subunit IV